MKIIAFCRGLIGLGVHKGLISILLSLSSYLKSSSVVGLSSSSYYFYHYSIHSKVMQALSGQLEASDNTFCSDLRALLFAQLPAVCPSTYRIVSDFTSISKPHSPSLSGRGFVPIPNCVIKGNKPIDIGYQYSYLNLGWYEQEAAVNATSPTNLDANWSLPLSQERLEVDADKLEVACEQLSTLLKDEQLSLHTATKVVNMVDSAYSQPRYIRPLVQEHEQLLVLARLRYGSKVYTRYEGEQKHEGVNKTYDDAPYYLQVEQERNCYHPPTKTSRPMAQRPIFERPTDDYQELGSQTKKGKAIRVKIWRWNELLLRGTRENPMKDTPFDLVAIQQMDKHTGKPLFQRIMFVAIFGQQRHEHSTTQARTDYLHRYDIEPFFRFSKQQLLLDKYQSPDVQHLDAWVQSVSLAQWMLFLAAQHTPINVPPWQQYLPEVKLAKQLQKSQSEQAPRKSPALSRKGMEGFLSTLDLSEFFPQESKNGQGRAKGTRFKPRTKHPPQRKRKKIEQNDEVKINIT